MSDSLASIVIHGAQDLQRQFLLIEKNTDRATMWTVREAGRRVKQAAKRAVPVYKGGGRAVTRKQAKTGGLAVNPNAPVKGLLKASISSSRRLIGSGGTYTNRVAPRGARVRLYSQRIEARSSYMASAQSKVAGQISAIAEQAYARATRGR